MCLIPNSEVENRLRQELQAKGSITAYKILRKHHGSLHSCTYHHILWHQNMMDCITCPNRKLGCHVGNGYSNIQGMYLRYTKKELAELVKNGRIEVPKNIISKVVGFYLCTPDHCYKIT